MALGFTLETKSVSHKDFNHQDEKRLEYGFVNRDWCDTLNTFNSQQDKYRLNLQIVVDDSAVHSQIHGSGIGNQLEKLIQNWGGAIQEAIFKAVLKFIEYMEGNPPTDGELLITVRR